MRPTARKRLMLYCALAATLALSAAAARVGSGTDPLSPVVPAPARRSTPVPAPEAVLRIELERLRDAANDARQVSSDTAFAVTSWYVPPPPPLPKPPPRPVPPPPPSAPPLPFSFLGRYEEEGAVTVLLVRGDRMYTVSEGAVIDNTYRVDRITARQLELTYLPLNIRQAIQAGGS